MTVQAFISYSFKDGEIMNILRKKLQSNAVKCYVSQHDDNYGGQLPEKLTSAIDSSNVVVVIFTKNGSESPTVNQEIGYSKNRKRTIFLLEPGIAPPVFHQGTEYAEFTPENMNKIFSKVSKFVATKPLEMKKSTGKSLKEIVEQEGIDSPTDVGFTKLVLTIGRKYLMKRHGRLDVSLKKEITVLLIIGIGLLVPIFGILFWSINVHAVIEPTFLYVGIGLAIPGALVLTSIEITHKRKCHECGNNFGIEMTESKLVDSKEVGRTEFHRRVREVYRNTYTCKFCDNTSIKNEQKEYNIPLED